MVIIVHYSEGLDAGARWPAPAKPGSRARRPARSGGAPAAPLQLRGLLLRQLLPLLLLLLLRAPLSDPFVARFAAAC